MIDLDIPGMGEIKLKHLVFDVNGTLAVDGKLITGVADQIQSLHSKLTIHLLTADTHGKQNLIDQELGLDAVRIQPGAEARQKADFIHKLGSKETAAIGQGANDSLMLKSAALGICVLSSEGAALETMLNADLIMPDILAALAALQNPLRIIASLRK